MMLRHVFIIFTLLFAVVVTVTILTDPDPTVQSAIQTFEVKDEYDSTWKSRIEPIHENTSRNTQTTQ